MEYENEINEIIDLILEKHFDTSREKMNEDIKTGVKNGYSSEDQVKLIKAFLA